MPSSTTSTHQTDRFHFDGGVAVVTGAASGLGLAITRACLRKNMRVAMADIDAAGLNRLEAELGEERCFGVVTDVREPQALESLADRTYAAYGRVDVLFNNAGVVVTRSVLETTIADWRWMLDVNLHSVINGIAAFVPRMLRQDGEARIVNTASAAGFLSEPYLGAYSVSKHAVVVLSETVHKELSRQGARLGVTILSPAFVPTGITNSERNRPVEYGDGTGSLSEVTRAAQAQLHKAIHSGRLTAEDVARIALDAVERRRLHVFTHSKIQAGIEARMAEIAAGFAP